MNPHKTGESPIFAHMVNSFGVSSIRSLVRAALKEDLGGRGDVTSLATIPAGSRSRARIIAKQHGILCGMDLAAEVFRQCGGGLAVKRRCRDGTPLRRGRTVLEIHGNTRGILAAERTALNFLQRLSGIATLTRRFVKNSESRIQNPELRILDTRKTTPLLRSLEKYAARCGGGQNHRLGLYDMILIKDNHLAALAAQFSNPIREAVIRARKHWPKLKVEVECDTLAQVREAVVAGADMILLDNMMPARLRRAVRIVAGRAITEASGGITLRNVHSIARTGVDCISVGALTHSAPALDFSLEIG